MPKQVDQYARHVEEFNSKVNEFIEEALDVTEAIQQEAVISLFSDIVIATPVDEGRLRSNWFASGKNPSNAVNDTRSVGQALGLIKTVAKSVKGDTYTLTNNLPYAVTVEFGGFNYNPKSGKTTSSGFSTQAPQGMMRANTLRWSNLVNEEARKRGNP